MAMTSRSPTIEWLAESDADEVFELYASCFSPSAAAHFRARRIWMFNENPAGGPALAWVARSGDQLVGHLATVAQKYLIDGESVSTRYPCDLMVRDGFGIQAIAMMRECFAAAPNIISLDEVAATQSVLKLMKATPVGSTNKWVKPLDLRFLKHRKSSAGRMPSQILAGARGPMSAIDALRKPRMQSSLKVEPLSSASTGEFDARFDVFASNHAEIASAVLDRNARYLNWRYGRTSPHASRFVGVATDATHHLRGYVIGCTTTAADGGGIVLELHSIEPENLELWRALMHFAVKRFRSEGASYIRIHHLPTAFSVPATVLKEFGFRDREQPQELTIRFEDPHADVAKHQESWSYGFGDSETSFSLPGAARPSKLQA